MPSNPPPLSPAGDTPDSRISRASIVSDVTLTDAFADDDEFYDLVEEDSMARHSSSLLEYSDTTLDADDPSQRSNSPTKLEPQRNDPNLASSTTSRFRLRDDLLSKSMRIVRFLSDGSDQDEENQRPKYPSKRQQHTHHHQQQHHASRASQQQQQQHHASRASQQQQQQHHASRSSHQKKESSRSRSGRHHRRQPNYGLASSTENWMAKLAYSFRSPQMNEPRKKHRRTQSPITQEYPHFVGSGYKEQNEDTPLLVSATFPEVMTKEQSVTRASLDELEEKDYISVAAAFLSDYEANRPPTFAARRLEDITNRQLGIYDIRYRRPVCKILLASATLAFFVSSFLEGFFNRPFDRILLTALNVFGISLYTVDLWIRYQLHRPSGSKRGRRARRQLMRNGLDHDVRLSRSKVLVQPLILFCVVLAIENFARLLVTPGDSLVLFSSVFKPLVLFYVSSKARDALEALSRIIRIVIRVLAMELLLILMFAAVAVRLFENYDDFRDLSTSWLSLFELSTTVVNPSIWMPMYRANKASAFFFIFFIVTSVFYLHSLVLSVVFQTYVHAATEIHQRSATDREDAVHLAYLALKNHNQEQRGSQSRRELISVRSVRDTLELVRPHYNALKINALVEIVAPSNQTMVDYSTFRTKIRQALNASIRTARSASPMAMIAELMAVAVALVNFVYVILVSSEFSANWFDSMQESIGCAITLVAGCELLIRFNPFRIPDFTPMTRLNATFDGLALVATCVSAYGMAMFVVGYPRALDYILMGRAIDMIRVMRFFEIFRDIVRRSSDVFPALLGPVILVVATLHVFVYAGMALWGGAIFVGTYGDQIEPLYDLNNFNGYQEGIVTMFQVLVVNDWHAIANTFLLANRFSAYYIVFPFFVIGNLVGVSIMLNVLTAFFVETFVTKVNDDTNSPAEATATVHKDKDYSIRTSENSPLKRIASGSGFAQMQRGNGSDHDADSEGSSLSELFEFDVYEREGFDKIMQTVAGANESNDYARHICGYLEIFESLSPGRETVGWLVCDQQTLDRFGNRRFQDKAAGFLEDNELHVVVSDMHAELLALATRASFQDRSLIRRFPHKSGASSSLEISASLLRRRPALSLFVSRVVEQTGTDDPESHPSF